MNSKTFLLLAMLGLVSRVTLAEDKNLQSRIDEVNGKIKTEQEANQKLKDNMSARDKEIADLKQKLKELEAQSASAKPGNP